jgi:hypothetical protein
MARQSVTVSPPTAAGTSQSSGIPAASREGAADYTLTDLELLGLAEEARRETRDGADRGNGRTPEKGASAARAGESANREEDGTQAPAAQKEQASGETLAEFAPAFELPGVGPKLRETCEQALAYREAFPTVEEARAVREVFANADAARAAAVAQSELARLDALVESSDPRAHAELLAGLERLAPESIRSLAVTFAQLLPRLDAEAYRQVRQAFLSQTLTQQGPVPPEKPAAGAQTLPGSKPSTWGSASVSGEAEAEEGQILPGSGSATRMSVPPETQIRAAQAAGEFLEAVNTDVQQALHEVIGQKVEELLPDAPEGARQKIAGEIFRELDLSLRGDPELQEQVRDAVRGATQEIAAAPGGRGAWRDRRHEAADPSAPPGTGKSVRASGLARLIARRARAALPSVAKRVVADWTETVLRSSQARRARQAEAASRTEIGRGGAPAPVPAVPRRVDYSRMSDEEILNME